MKLITYARAHKTPAVTPVAPTNPALQGDLSKALALPPGTYQYEVEHSPTGPTLVHCSYFLDIALQSAASVAPAKGEFTLTFPPAENHGSDWSEALASAIANEVDAQVLTGAGQPDKAKSGSLLSDALITEALKKALLEPSPLELIKTPDKFTVQDLKFVIEPAKKGPPKV